MSAIDQEIFEIVQRLDEARKQRLLDVARKMEVPDTRSYSLDELKNYHLSNAMKR